MKLTQDQIQSIDTYLINSDVRFIDVRIEMVDHIAEALEVKMKDEQLSFYEAFKRYMLEHKKDLLKNYEKLKKKNQLKGFSAVWHNLKKPWMIIVFALSFVFLMNFNSLFGVDFPYIIVMWSILICTSLIYILFSYPFSKNRFSGLEALSWVMFTISYFFQVVFNFAKPKPLFYDKVPISINIFVAFITCFCIAWIFTFFKERRKYKIEYALA